MYRKIVIGFLIFGVVMMLFGSCGVCRCAAGSFCGRGYRSSYHRRGYGYRPRSSSSFFFFGGNRGSSRRSSFFSRSSYRSRGFSFGK